MTRAARAFPVAAVALAAACALATPAVAQGDARPRAELRAEVLAPENATAGHLGVGIAVPSGTYLRLAVVAAAGASWSEEEAVPSGRVDAVARFQVDPFRESPWAPYGIGGASVLLREGARRSFVLTIGLGLEGPRRGGVVPAFEVALGGGVRAGVVLRQARRDRR